MGINRIQVVTCNSEYVGGKFIGTYHEIHEIDNLRNVSHMIFAVHSVITNHLMFKPDEDILDMVIVSGNNSDMIKRVVEYFELDPMKVKVIETQTVYS